MNIGSLFLELLADGSKLTPSVTAAAAKAGDAGAKTLGQRLSGAFNQQAKSFTVGALAAGAVTKAFGFVSEAIGNVTGFLKDSAQAYLDEDASIHKLTTSLAANVQGFNGNTAAIERRIKASETLGFTDTDLRESLSLLVAATHDVDKAFSLQHAAMDLARFKNISLQDATVALTSLEAGRARGLATLGINVKDFATTEERIAAVEKVAGGQAADYAGTLSGKLDVAYVRVHDSQEKFGKELAIIEAATLPAAADALGVVADEVQGLGTAFDKSATPLDKQNAALTVLNDLGGASLPIFGDMIAKANAAAKAEQDAADAAAGLGSRAGKLADDLAAVTGATVPLTSANDSLGASWDTARSAASALDSGLKLLDATLFGTAIQAGDVASATKNVTDTINSGKGLKAGTQAFVIWQGQVAAAKQTLFDLQYQEKEKEGPQALLDWLKKQRDGLASTDKKGRALISTYIDLAKLQAGLKNATVNQSFLSKIQKLGIFAEGGHYSANQPRLVGERGPELDIPDHSGTIVPIPDPMRWLRTPSASPTNAIRSGAAVLSGQSGPAAGRAGDTYHNTWVLPEPTTRDPFEVLDATARYIRWGRLRPGAPNG